MSSDALLLVEHSSLAKWEAQLEDAERLIRWATSVAVIARAEIFAAHAAQGLSEWAAESISMVEECSPQGAATRLGWSMTLADQLPVTLHLLREGHLPVATARMVAEQAAMLDDQQCAVLEARLWPQGVHTIPSATARRTGALRRRIRLLLPAMTEPDTVDLQVVAARRGRRIELWDGPPGTDTAIVAATLTSPDAAAVMASLDEYARATDPADPRGADELRADAFVELLTGQPSFALWADHASGEPLPTARHWTVQVTVAVDVLTGHSHDAGIINRVGPVAASTAAAVARAAINAGARITRLVTDPLSGALLDTTTIPRQRKHGSPPGIASVIEHNYRPSQALADYVRARDQRCQLPGCPIPAQRCELDHITPYDQGGTTTASNLTCLCKHHHRLKHSHGWHLHRTPNSQLIWSTPTGRTITMGPGMSSEGQQPTSREPNQPTNASMPMRSCSMVSRERTVTARSSNDSKSTVTQNGVPISS